MMTFREARQRISMNGGNIRFNRESGDYRVALNEWCEEAKAYYTDDLEDAVLTVSAMRRTADMHAIVKV